jgi:microcystin-dependent protein
MPSLRPSGGLTNLVADTLRLRDLSGGLLTLSDRGVIRNDASPALRNLTVSGSTMLHTTTVFSTLTANSVDALVSIKSPAAYFTSIDVSNATVTHLNVAFTSISRLDASSAFIDLLDVSSATVKRMDVSSAFISLLDISSATVKRMDASSAFISLLDVSSATVKRMDVSSAFISLLDVSSATIKRMDASSAVISLLDVSSATVKRMDASSAFITDLDVSTASIYSLDASSASVSGRISARDILIGQNTVLSDPTANFVFINAGAEQTVATVRGSNRPTGTLALGANAASPSNILLNANGSTDIKSLDVSAGVITSHGIPITVPSGSITMYGGTSANIPAGWLLCDGRAVLRSQYSTLFALTGILYGSGDGILTFNLPNMQMRFPMGAGGSYSPGNVGGNANIALNTTNLPAHQHGLNNVQTAGFSEHRHRYIDTTLGVRTGTLLEGITTGNNDLFQANLEKATGDPNMNELRLTDLAGGTPLTDSTGSGSTFSILPPFLAINYIIKY